MKTGGRTGRQTGAYPIATAAAAAASGRFIPLHIESLPPSLFGISGRIDMSRAKSQTGQRTAGKSEVALRWRSCQSGKDTYHVPRYLTGIS